MSKNYLYLASLSITAFLFIIIIRGQERKSKTVVSKAEYTCLAADSTVRPDSLMEALIAPYRDSLNQKMSQTLCETGELLFAKRPESNLMRLLSTILLQSGQEVARNNGLPVPDFSLLNAGGMRAPIAQGEVSVQDIFQVAPFENAAVVLNLDSADVVALVGHVCDRGGEAFAGITVEVDSDWHPADIRIAGEPLRSGRVYRLATIDYLATGGDGFECLVGHLEYETGILLRNVLIDYFIEAGKKGEPVMAPTDVRLRLPDTGTTTNR